MLENCTRTEEKLIDVEQDVYDLVDIDLRYGSDSDSRFRHLTWMAENFRCGSFNDGTRIFFARTKMDWDDALRNNIPAYCFPGFDLKNARYGALYNIHVFTSQRNLCPDRWRVTMFRNWHDLQHIIHDKAGWEGNRNAMKYFTKDNWGLDINSETEGDLLGLNFKHIPEELLEAVNGMGDQYYALADPDGLRPKRDQKTPIIDLGDKDGLECYIIGVKRGFFEAGPRNLVPLRMGFFVRMVRYKSYD